MSTRVREPHGSFAVNPRPTATRSLRTPGHGHIRPIFPEYYGNPEWVAPLPVLRVCGERRVLPGVPSTDRRRRGTSEVCGDAEHSAELSHIVTVVIRRLVALMEVDLLLRR